LIEILKKGYNINDGCLATFGMNAITATIESMSNKSNDSESSIIYASELYCDSKKFIERLQKYATTYKVDITDSKDIYNKLTTLKNNLIFFIESCSNPSGYMVDMSIVQQAKKK